MNRKGIVLSGLVYALLTFFLLLIVGLLAILWYRQNAIDELSRDANAIYDDPYIPDDVGAFEFVYTGDYQTFTVPKSGKYKVELWGAQGGVTGLGAYVAGEILLEGASTLYIYVGGAGVNAGYNGGGKFSISGSIMARTNGGGATDIRLVGGDFNNINSLKSRIIIAAGGGGNSHGGYGGQGGGLIGYRGETMEYSGADTRGYGGTQTAGGQAGENTWTGDAPTDGIFGIGGSGNGSYGGGGGGGYYGGGGSGVSSMSNGSGAGGSSFISGHSGCDAINEAGAHTGQPNHYSGYVFISTQMKAGNETMPIPTGGTETGHSGNGYARITYLP